MKQTQNVLIVGGGGREHALAWKIAQSPKLNRLYVAPGNAGTHQIATNVSIPAQDIKGLVQFAIERDIDITLVAPDDALAAGLVDALQAAGRRAFGPTQAAARIESSKVFAKNIMTRQHIPTASYETFDNVEVASRYVKTHSYPLVIKASGLALGKGVVICQTQEEAFQALQEIMAEKIFGESGGSVVIEDYLAGQEVSIHAFCDGQTTSLFPVAQDHKRIGTSDTGLNTGGMGTFAPVPWVSPSTLKQIGTSVVDAALTGLRNAGSPFTGVLYPGLMIDGSDLRVLEYNARFGDPETQSYMRLLETDLLDILNACVDGSLAALKIEWNHHTAVSVVLASEGYPGRYPTDLPITGLDAAAARPDIVIFHAGTKHIDDQVVTSGGRVLSVSAVGRDLADARNKAYDAIRLIHFKGMQYRSDIGSKALIR